MPAGRLTPDPPVGADRTEVVGWLLEGDAAVRYATTRYLLGGDVPTRTARAARAARETRAALVALAEAVPTEGDAAAILAARHTNGHWGRGFYQPKWTSTHYTLLELAGLGGRP